MNSIFGAHDAAKAFVRAVQADRTKQAAGARRKAEEAPSEWVDPVILAAVAGLS